jgi:hypothetical protein
MHYALVKLQDYSGKYCNVYSILPHKKDVTLFESFVFEQIEERKTELLDISTRIRLMGQKFGARHSYFKHFEGKYGDFVCALYDLPSKALRLYCIRFGNEVLILGGGGEKPKYIKAWQENPKLAYEATQMIQYAQDIAKRMLRGELYWSADKTDLEGNFNYNEGEEHESN